jgi:hypothetical protein
LTEVNLDAIWYEVSDPMIAQERVTLVNDTLTYLMMRARKTAEVELFKSVPQQSDYACVEWHKRTPDRAMDYLRLPVGQQLAERYLPRAARVLLRRVKQATRRHFASPHLKEARRF